MKYITRTFHSAQTSFFWWVTLYIPHEKFRAFQSIICNELISLFMLVFAWKLCSLLEVHYHDSAKRKILIIIHISIYILKKKEKNIINESSFWNADNITKGRRNQSRSNSRKQNEGKTNCRNGSSCFCAHSALKIWQKVQFGQVALFALKDKISRFW